MQFLPLIIRQKFKLSIKICKAVSWGNECANLAAAGWDESTGTNLGLTQLYTFANNKLSLVASLVMSYYSQFNSVGWCDNGEYLAAAGVKGAEGANDEAGIAQLYKISQSTILSPPTVRAQNSSQWLPMQRDIINTLCWSAVADAVTYNVYADAALTTVLAQVTKKPYCYSQHQIKPGISKTYYVTSVDAKGNESDPTAITI